MHALRCHLAEVYTSVGLGGFCVVLKKKSY
jgi:hypothetical protein